MSRHEKSKHLPWMLIAFFRTVSLFNGALLLIESVRKMHIFVFIHYTCYISLVIHSGSLAWLCSAFSQACRLGKLG